MTRTFLTVDGKKRVAFAAADAFLRINGHYIHGDSQEAYDHLMRLFDSNTFRFTELTAWLTETVKPL